MADDDTSMTCAPGEAVHRSEATEVVVRLPATLHAMLKERAETDERSMAATVRVALRQYLLRPVDA